MSHDGRPERALDGARAAAPDRRTAIVAIAGLTLSIAIAACGGTSSSGGVAGATGTPTASGAASASAEASASAAASNGLSQGFLTFTEQNGSKVFGGGTITDLGDGSSAVTLGVVAVGYADPLPARLVSGSCADAATAPLPSFAPPPSEAPSGAPASAAPSTAPSAAASAGASAATGSIAPTPATLPLDLTPVSGGGSNTVVQIALADVLSTPSSVLVYKSAADPSLVACADVSATLVVPSAAPAASAPAASASEVPAASGSTAP